MYAAARDVTEQRKAREEIDKLNGNLRAQASQLEAANKELEAFSYSVSHDLRAPLRHIDGYVARLTKATGEKLDDKSRRYLRIISEAAREMGQLIDDLLVFSRVGRVEMLETKVDLERVVEDATAGVRAEANGRKIVWKHGRLPTVPGVSVLL